MSSVTDFLNSPGSVGLWTLVPEQSTIRFENTTMWGAVRIGGAFTEFNGDGEIHDAQTVTGRVDIKAASVNTKLGKRDEELRSANFFDVERYPNITVAVTGGEPAGTDTVRLRAELTAKGITAPLPLRTHVDVLDDGGVRLRAQATVKRKQWDVTGNMFGMVGAKTAVKASLVFRRSGS